MKTAGRQAGGWRQVNKGDKKRGGRRRRGRGRGTDKANAQTNTLISRKTKQSKAKTF